MGELIIRRNRTFVPPQYQGAAKTEKASSTGQTRPVDKAGAATLSETLQQLMGQSGPADGRVREGRRALQAGEGILASVRDSLERLAELAEKAAQGDEEDREALQAELESLRSDVSRMLQGATAGDIPLFREENTGVKGLAQLLLGLIEKVEAGVSPDQAIQELTGGAFTTLAEFQEQLTSAAAPDLQELLAAMLAGGGSLSSASLLALLAGLKGGGLDLLMSLLSGAQTLPAGPEAQSGSPSQAGTPPSQAEEAQVRSARLGPVQAEGRDLSGVTYDASSGRLTASGPEGVLFRGTGQEVSTLLVSGSGTVTVQDIDAQALIVHGGEARLLLTGDNAIALLQLEEEASLTLEGEGRLVLDAFRAASSASLRLTGGAVQVKGEKGEALGALNVPVVIDGPAVLAARPLSVHTPAGKAAAPFDLIWKTLLPGWKGLDSLELNGRQARLALLSGDPARLWLEKGDPSHGWPAHALVLRGKDESGQLKTRYAYLQWNRKTEAFEEITMYPNPFAVTGGEAGRDWVYEEQTHTLHILSSQVTALSGGAGIDANHLPFSGRIALADGIGALKLTLEGVTCQVDAGRAFDLGQENQVTLILPGGASNLFESGAGCAGISVGVGTLLCVDCAQPPEEEDEFTAGALTASGGIGCAGIGRDGVAGWDPAGPILVRSEGGEVMHDFLGPVTIAGGVVSSPGGEESLTVQLGEEDVILPRFCLSVRSLGLDEMNLRTRESARLAKSTLETDLRLVSRVQAVYNALSGQLDRNPDRPTAAPRGSLVRDSTSAGTLLENTRRSILLQPAQTIGAHSQRAAEEIEQLLS
jgi:hypothetical protein